MNKNIYILEASRQWTVLLKRENLKSDKKYHSKELQQTRNETECLPQVSDRVKARILPYMYIILTGATNDHRSLIECKIFISCSDSRHLKNDRRDSNKKLIHGMIRNHTDNNFIVLNERKTRNVYIFMTFCLKLWLICYYLLST